MAVLGTKIIWDIEGKAEINTADEIRFNRIDFNLNSTSIIFLVGENEVSRFILQIDYKVFFEEQVTPIVGVSNESFQNTVKDLNIWVDAIQGFINLPKSPQANFNAEIDKGDDEITSKFRLKEASSILLFDARWDRGDDTFRFGPRDESIIPWPDFLKYVEAVNKFLKEVNFAKLT